MINTEGVAGSLASSKGFLVLEEVNPGEGFWLNCIEGVTLECNYSGG